jgi:hypothetical protein
MILTVVRPPVKGEDPETKKRDRKEELKPGG